MVPDWAVGDAEMLTELRHNEVVAIKSGRRASISKISRAGLLALNERGK